MYNLLIGGAAGQGIDTTAAVLEKLLKRAGYNVLTVRDVMSRVRGGHNFSLIRFGDSPVLSHSNVLDGIIALNEETAKLHQENLKEDGFILCDKSMKIDDSRALRIPMADMAKEIGNPRVAGTIAVGVVLKLFGEGLDNAQDVLGASLKEKYLDINIEAIKKGHDAAESRFERKAGDFGKWMNITGSQAVALGAIAGGLQFYSAYPMSPSTAIMEYLASKSEDAGLVVEQAEDEIAAINMAIGASYAGARAMTGTSGGGFSLMVEGLGLAGISETPVVIADVQRPGPATGLPTRTEQGDLKFVISASQGEFPRIVIALKNHRDAFYQTARALELADQYQTPVILLSDQYLADSSATVELFDVKGLESKKTDGPPESGEYLRYAITESGISPRLAPGQTEHLVYIDSDEHDEKGWITESAEVRTKMVDKRMRKMESFEPQEPEFLGAEDFDVLLLGWGSMHGPIAEAVKTLEGEGKKIAALVFGDVYPLPQKKLEEMAGKAGKIIHVEQNATGQFADLVREQTGIACAQSILKYDGRQLTGGEIADRLRKEAF
jgi:2-oxoglutarate ferredoxin oxidoreductase subunit alpha